MKDYKNDNQQELLWLVSARGRIKQLCQKAEAGWREWVLGADGIFQDKGPCSHDHEDVSEWPPPCSTGWTVDKDGGKV